MFWVCPTLSGTLTSKCSASLEDQVRSNPNPRLIEKEYMERNEGNSYSYLA